MQFQNSHHNPQDTFISQLNGAELSDSCIKQINKNACACVCVWCVWRVQSCSLTLVEITAEIMLGRLASSSSSSASSSLKCVPYSKRMNSFSLLQLPDSQTHTRTHDTQHTCAHTLTPCGVTARAHVSVYRLADRQTEIRSTFVHSMEMNGH